MRMSDWSSDVCSSDLFCADWGGRRSVPQLQSVSGDLSEQLCRPRSQRFSTSELLACRPRKVPHGCPHGGMGAQGLATGVLGSNSGIDGYARSSRREGTLPNSEPLVTRNFGKY